MLRRSRAAAADRPHEPVLHTGPISSLAWHAQSVDEVFRAFATTASGLSAEEAAVRLDSYGANELQAFEPASVWHTLAAQFKNVLILILLAATMLSGLLGHALEASVIAVIVLFAVLLGFIQEYRAERALEALRKMAAPLGHVIREGVERSIPSREVIPGDLVVLRAGDRVPADGRITTAVNLAIDEAALTGESAAITKTSSQLPFDKLAIGDRRNMAYAGTVVTYGRGRAVVVATGMSTEFGRISGLVQTVEAGRSPLQENLDALGRILGKAALVIGALIVALGLWRGLPLLDMLIFGIALAVAVVPEALPAVVTISLAIGVRRMVRRNALVRRLPVVETLGSTSVICSDKTGTLRKNEMTVREIFVGGRLLTVSGVGYNPAGTFRVHSVHGVGRWRELGNAACRGAVVRRQAATRGRTLADRRRPHGGGADRGCRHGWPRSCVARAAIRAHRRDPLQFRAAANDDAPHGYRPVNRVLERSADVVLDGCMYWVGPSGDLLLTSSDRDRCGRDDR